VPDTQLLTVWDITGVAEPLPNLVLLDAKVSLSHIRKLAFLPSGGKIPGGAGPQGTSTTASNDAEVELVSCGFENVSHNSTKKRIRVLPVLVLVLLVLLLLRLLLVLVLVLVLAGTSTSTSTSTSTTSTSTRPKNHTEVELVS